METMDNHIWIMLIISIIAGLLSTMNNWAYSFNDIRFHLNDIFMASLMTGWMILFMTIIFFNKIKNNYLFIILSIAIIVITLICIRTQFLIYENQYLNSMIPHHSMAIQMSEKIKEKTNDPRIINFANKIIESQKSEINEMKNILKDYQS